MLPLVFFFTHLLLVFLISIFDVRRYNGAYLSCAYVSRPMKFTTFIDKSQEKINQFPAYTGAIRSYLKLQEKDCLSKIYIYFL